MTEFDFYFFSIDKRGVSSAQEVLKYFNEVLGVTQVLVDASPVSLTPRAGFVFIVENYVSYTADEKELLMKMIAAMKLDIAQVQIQDLNQSSADEAARCIYLVDQPGADQSYSPRVLIKNPKLKKTTWDFLQTKMQ